MTNKALLEDDTGNLFEKLWGPYTDKLFKESVDLFFKRLEIVGLEKNIFHEKKCLDAGCGGGRNSIAMSMAGARQVEGIDLGELGIEDARNRAKNINITNINFQKASILDIPYQDETFDFVWCAGVVMITQDPSKALSELCRVLKPGGQLYILVYATGGLRWPLINLLRPFAKILGQENFEKAIDLSREPSNKRRTFLDDLYCPKLDFFSNERMHRELRNAGISGQIKRWPESARIDHEHSLAEYKKDLESLLTILEAGNSLDFEAQEKEYFNIMANLVKNTIEGINIRIISLGPKAVDDILIGQGHHRMLCTK